MAKFTSLGIFAFVWGVIGICTLLAAAIFRLGGIAIAMFDYELQVQHWAILVLFIGFMAYSEGYRGFHLSFSPRFAARLRYLLTSDNFLYALTAPLFCMGFFYTTRRRMVSAYALTLMIIGFVILVQSIPQPWRGILDAGVVIGLAWGLISLVYFAARALVADSFDFSPQLPMEKHLPG